MPSTPDPYAAVAGLLAAASREAARRADLDDAFPSPWANAEMALQLAITGLPTPDPGDADSFAEQVTDQDCLGLVVQAISVLDHVAPNERRPEHLLDVGYALRAAKDVRRALHAQSAPG